MPPVVRAPSPVRARSRRGKSPFMQTTTSESLYRRLQQHLDRMPVGFPATQSGVEIRILQRLFTPMRPKSRWN